MEGKYRFSAIPLGYSGNRGRGVLMVAHGTQLERARREGRVMAELAALAMTADDYGDTVQHVLRIVEQVVSSPLLCLSVQEIDAPGHYIRTGTGVDSVWSDVAGRSLAERLEARPAEAPPAVEPYTIPGPPAWFLVFPAQTRSGRTGALALGAPEPPVVEPAEAQLMLRLASQALLVLDHALLLLQVQDADPIDGLTGLASYRRLLDTLDYELIRHRHTGRWLALMLLDVEALRQINRSYGRRYGNHILRRLAEQVRDVVRPIDLVARCGPHDVAVMLPETDAEEATALSDALRERFTGFEFAGGAVGLSVGVAHARPGEILTPESLLHRAEGALAEAKQQEREWDTISALSAPAGTRGLRRGS